MKLNIQGREASRHIILTQVAFLLQAKSVEYKEWFNQKQSVHHVRGSVDRKEVCLLLLKCLLGCQDIMF